MPRKFLKWGKINDKWCKIFFSCWSYIVFAWQIARKISIIYIMLNGDTVIYTSFVFSNLAWTFFLFSVLCLLSDQLRISEWQDYPITVYRNFGFSLMALIFQFQLFILNKIYINCVKSDIAYPQNSFTFF